MRSLWNKLIAVIDTPLWLEIFFAVLLVLRIPTFFEPYYYGDEMIYLALGEGIRQGIPLYLGLHDNKPPLLYLLAAISGNLFVFKAILAFWNLATVYVFWKLTKSLFPNKFTLHKIATVIFGLLTTLPFLEGNTANAELFFIGPVIFAFWILLFKPNNFKNIFFAGIMFSLASLFKIPAAFDILGITVFWIIYERLKIFGKFILNLFYLFLGFITPIIFTFVWYYFAGSFKEYFIAAFMQNFGYVSSWRANSEEIPFLVKNGPLLIRAGIMFLGFFGLWLSRRKLSKNFVLITGWLLATLFAVTLSERPYPHYFVQSIAPLSILLGMLFSLKTVEQSLTVIPLTLAFFVPFYYKFWYYPTTTYYQRFIEFATGRIDKTEYFAKFSTNLETNYAVSEYVAKSTAPTDKVFVWSNDSAAIYSLSRRMPPIKYVADYHVYDYSSKALEAKKIEEGLPKFIILTNSYPYPELGNLIRQKYILINQIEDANIYSRIDFAPKR